MLAINSSFIRSDIRNLMEAKRPHRARTDVAYLDIASPPAHSPRPLKEEFDDTLLTSSGLSELRK